VDIITKATADLTVALGVAIKGVKALIGVSADVALGVKVDLAVCIQLLAQIVVVCAECVASVPCAYSWVFLETLPLPRIRPLPLRQDQHRAVQAFARRCWVSILKFNVLPSPSNKCLHSKLIIELLVQVIVVVKGLDGVLGLVLHLLVTLLGGCFNAVIALGLQVELGACLGIKL